jgi:hypothetical protein
MTSATCPASGTRQTTPDFDEINQLHPTVQVLLSLSRRRFKFQQIIQLVQDAADTTWRAPQPVFLVSAQQESTWI